MILYDSYFVTQRGKNRKHGSWEAAKAIPPHVHVMKILQAVHSLGRKLLAQRLSRHICRGRAVLHTPRPSVTCCSPALPGLAKVGISQSGSLRHLPLLCVISHKQLLGWPSGFSSALPASVPALGPKSDVSWECLRPHSSISAYVSF